MEVVSARKWKVWIEKEQVVNVKVIEDLIQDSLTTWGFSTHGEIQNSIIIIWVTELSFKGNSSPPATVCTPTASWEQEETSQVVPHGDSKTGQVQHVWALRSVKSFWNTHISIYKLD